ncbi:MAG: hypothetical protein WBE18_07865 [Gammaproteobacteria bacterium]
MPEEIEQTEPIEESSSASDDESNPDIQPVLENPQEDEPEIPGPSGVNKFATPLAEREQYDFFFPDNKPNPAQFVIDELEKDAWDVAELFLVFTDYLKAIINTYKEKTGTENMDADVLLGISCFLFEKLKFQNKISNISYLKMNHFIQAYQHYIDIRALSLLEPNFEVSHSPYLDYILTTICNTFQTREPERSSLAAENVTTTALVTAFVELAYAENIVERFRESKININKLSFDNFDQDEINTIKPLLNNLEQASHALYKIFFKEVFIQLEQGRPTEDLYASYLGLLTRQMGDSLKIFVINNKDPQKISEINDFLIHLVKTFSKKKIAILPPEIRQALIDLYSAIYNEVFIQLTEGRSRQDIEQGPWILLNNEILNWLNSEEVPAQKIKEITPYIDQIIKTFKGNISSLPDLIQKNVLELYKILLEETVTQLKYGRVAKEIYIGPLGQFIQQIGNWLNTVTLVNPNAPIRYVTLSDDESTQNEISQYINAIISTFKKYQEIFSFETWQPVLDLYSVIFKNAFTQLELGQSIQDVSAGPLAPLIQETGNWFTSLIKKGESAPKIKEIIPYINDIVKTFESISNELEPKTQQDARELYQVLFRESFTQLNQGRSPQDIFSGPLGLLTHEVNNTLKTSALNNNNIRNEISVYIKIIIEKFTGNGGTLPPEAHHAASDLYCVFIKEVFIQAQHSQSMKNKQIALLTQLTSETDMWLNQISEKLTSEQIETATTDFRNRAARFIEDLDWPLSSKQRMLVALMTFIGAVLCAAAGFVVGAFMGGGIASIPTSIAGAAGGGAVGGAVGGLLAYKIIGFFNNENKATRIREQINLLIESKIKTPEFLKQQLIELGDMLMQFKQIGKEMLTSPKFSEQVLQTLRQELEQLIEKAGTILSSAENVKTGAPLTAGASDKKLKGKEQVTPLPATFPEDENPTPTPV